MYHTGTSGWKRKSYSCISLMTSMCLHLLSNIYYYSGIVFSPLYVIPWNNKIESYTAIINIHTSCMIIRIYTFIYSDFVPKAPARGFRLNPAFMRQRMCPYTDDFNRERINEYRAVYNTLLGRWQLWQFYINSLTIVMMGVWTGFYMKIAISSYNVPFVWNPTHLL